MAVTTGAGFGAHVVARDAEGNMIGERFPVIRVFADFIVSAKATETAK
jgi:hypothetical protein